MYKTSRTLAVCIGILAMPGMACASPTTLPPSLANAEQFNALADGHWLALEKNALRLLAADGREIASLALRADHLDSRSTPGGALALVFDDARHQSLLIDIDLALGRLAVGARLPEPAFSLESQCLYRDGQQLDHALLIGEDGQAEQWLLSGPAPRLLRKLALPPGVESCRVDDARHTLHIGEDGIGDWTYALDGEGVPTRSLVVAQTAKAQSAVRRNLQIVEPQAQTEPVARRGDAADDPAIWIHPLDPTQSLILGTNKKQGLLSYDLSGKTRQLLEVGRVNNVDVRQQVRLNGRSVDLALATQRDENALAVFEIDANGTLRDVARIATDLDDIYGTCLYQPASGGLEVIANDKDGRFVQYRIDWLDNTYVGVLLRRFSVASQPEGCVADDRAGRLFIGEEDHGIWALAADARADAAAPHLVLPVGPRLVADVEGLALYHGARASYLIASSQGDNSYVVLDALPPFAYRGAFRIGINAAAGIDGVSETDGLEVTALDLGGPYRQGMLVVQDGHNRLPDAPQNFKLVAWKDIARALGLE
jgi:myo-inositol-hexaphosphate 3-phosphohydrolase